jgi:predicted DNA-binding transcriptional regulator AlpA
VEPVRYSIGKRTSHVEKLLTMTEVAEALITPVETLRYWRQIGYGPPSCKLGRRVVYRESEVAAFVAQRMEAESPTSATQRSG